MAPTIKPVYKKKALFIFYAVVIPFSAIIVVISSETEVKGKDYNYF